MRHSALITVLCGLPTVALAATFGDWQVDCDNTRRCEAVGFQRDGAERAVALHLTREAGPGKRLQAELMLPDTEESVPGSFTLTVGSATVRGVELDQIIPAAALNALLPKMLDASEAVLASGKDKWVVSLTGMKAAMLKMDEVQGRLDTPGALVRKGSRPESAVLPALPVPLLKAARLPAQPEDETALVAAIDQAAARTDCSIEIDDELSGAWVVRLTPSKVLFARPCGRGAYQTSYELWMANVKAPFAPTPLRLPYPDGSLSSGLIDPDIENGVLHSYGKGRGVNDCGADFQWLWTVDGFKLLQAEAAHQCKGFFGGVPLRTYVATKG